jgi:vacuolar-type H+-ATPase subunit C/Vma6
MQREKEIDDEIAKEIERDKFTEEIVRILRETDYENSL